MSTIIQAPSFTLRMCPPSQLCLYITSNHQVMKLYSVKVGQEWEKCQGQNKMLELKNWFDSADQLINYIKFVEPNRVKVDLQQKVVVVFVRVRKGGDRFAKIGTIKLTQKILTQHMKLAWVYEECCLENDFSNKKIAGLIQVLLDAYKQISCGMLNQTSQASHGKQDLSKTQQGLLEVCRMFDMTQQSIQKENQHLSTQYDQFQAQQNCKFRQIQALIQVQETQKHKLNNYPIQPKVQTKIGWSNQKLQKVLAHIINTDSPYFSHFQIKNTWVVLAISSSRDNSVMFTYRHRMTDIIKYTVKIQRLTKRMGFGVVDQAHCNKIRCYPKDSLIKYATNGSYVYLKSFANSGQHLNQGETITVTADLKKGTIEWKSGSFLVYQSQVSILSSSEISWVPYIELSGKGDAIEWIPNDDSSN